MAKRSKKNSDELGGCGTSFIIFLVLCVIALITEYWQYVLLFVVVIAILALLAVISGYIAKRDKEVAERNAEIVRNTAVGKKLTGGYYTSGRDIPAGIYDVRVINGNGTLKLPINGNLKLSSNETFKNIELPSDSQLFIPVGMTIDFYNQRNLPKIEEKIPEISIKAISSEQSKAYYDIDNMEGHDFEYFCARVLRKNGYKDVEVTRGSGDHGVDIIAMRDGVKYAVQCKRYANGVGNKAIQEIYSGKAYYHCHVGIVMTNSYFTPSAKEEAERNGIILWDGEFLKPYLKQFNAPPDSPSNNFHGKSKVTAKEEKQVAEESEGDAKMYDVGKGIYPPGHYVIGKTLPKGAYLLKSRCGKPGSVSFYETLSNLLNDENATSYQTFDDDFFLTLFEDNAYISIGNADIQKVYGIN